VRVFATCLADCLARLTHGFSRHRAGVDDDGAPLERIEAGGTRLALYYLGFVGVEAAAECQNVYSHQATPSVSRCQTPVSGSKRPANSHSAGPVIMTWSSSRQ